MAKIKVDMLKTEIYAKLAGYDELNKANNTIIVANALKIKENIENKKILKSDVNDLGKIPHIDNFDDEKDM